jgi:hypothetical protein
MGQQQLLLLVIAVVLVALATVATFAIMERNYRQDEADGIMDRTLTIATQATGWHTSNIAFGPDNGSYERLLDIGISGLGMDTTNIRGRYAITDATENTLEVTGVSDRHEGIGVRVYITRYNVDSSRVSFDGDYTL